MGGSLPAGWAVWTMGTFVGGLNPAGQEKSGESSR